MQGKLRYRWLIDALVTAVLVVILALLAPEGQASPTAYIIYVDADAIAGGNDGESWEDAFTNLQDAFDAATTGDEIWVAAGTYKPTAEYGGTGERYRSFQMMNGVILYGGFDPSVGDTGFDDRDWEANPTILSGDIGIEGDSSDNSYHVFYHPASMVLDSTAILDGFTINGGNANGAYPHDKGGGMFNESGASPALANCIFTGNETGFNGGGMFNANSSATLSNCTFMGNSALYAGGGMANRSSSLSLIDCTFTDNSAVYGGGIYNFRSPSPTLTNCTFTDNSASSRGGGIFNDSGASPILANCIFAYNQADDKGGGMCNYSSSPVVTNCIFVNNQADGDGGGICNTGGSSPVVTNCVMWENIPEEISNNDPGSMPTVTYSDVQGGYDGVGNIEEYPWFVDPSNGDFHLEPDSPCIDVGDNYASYLPDLDSEGDYRILDGDCNGTAIVDMGVDEVTGVGTCFRIYLPAVLRFY